MSRGLVFGVLDLRVWRRSFSGFRVSGSHFAGGSGI